MATIAVFCGSRSGESEAFTHEAVAFAEALVTTGHSVVYGGGSTGIMGAIANTCLQGGGNITGVIPEFLATDELMHPDVEMQVVADMHKRKQMLHELADAYAVLPGGFGTMEEAFEAIAWRQLKLHPNPVGVLNCDGMFDGLQILCTSLLKSGFISSQCYQLVKFHTSAIDLANWLNATC